MFAAAFIPSRKENKTDREACLIQGGYIMKNKK